MTGELEQRFLKHSVEKLEQYSGRIETCLKMLNEEQVWARGGENENAAGNLVLHLCGNVRQWIMHGVGGQPDHRDRNSEFDARGGMTVTALIEKLRGTVKDAAEVIPASAGHLAEQRTIQGYHVSVMEAIYHVVEHFAMHTGQILFVTKMLTGTDLGFYTHLKSRAAHTEKRP